MNGQPSLVCRWADVALIGVTVNLVVLVAAPVLRPDLNVLEKSLSYYAAGPWGIVQATAFAGLGVASIALSVALRESHVPSRWLSSSILLLMVAGFASLGLVRYPMGNPGPVTVLGDAHQTAGTVGGVAQLAAVLAFAMAARSGPAWSSLSVTAPAVFFVALAGALLSQMAIWWPHLGIPMGATMRLFVVPLVVFWGLVAIRLRRTCGQDASQFAGVR